MERAWRERGGGEGGRETGQLEETREEERENQADATNLFGRETSIWVVSEEGTEEGDSVWRRGREVEVPGLFGDMREEDIVWEFGVTLIMITEKRAYRAGGGKRVRTRQDGSRKGERSVPANLPPSDSPSRSRSS